MGISSGFWGKFLALTHEWERQRDYWMHLGDTSAFPWEFRGLSGHGIEVLGGLVSGWLASGWTGTLSLAVRVSGFGRNVQGGLAVDSVAVVRCDCCLLATFVDVCEH